ncbi:hypothetical protein R1flu_013739 [Riccia fluitans]|uniref:SGF29 C-terminal domain-containing protein n=1 Tax=Riccia fluitans TaxID=41844 RepID=A0ABD1YE93_9MARC
MIDRLEQEVEILRGEEVRLYEEVGAFYNARNSFTCYSPDHEVPVNKTDNESKKLKSPRELFPDDVPRKLLPTGTRVRAVYPGTANYCKARIVGLDSPDPEDYEASHYLYLVKFKREETLAERIEGTAVWKIPFHEVVPRE